MIPYKNLGGDSGVIAYMYDSSSITVRFNKGTYTQYSYTHTSAGVDSIEKMKKLANIGRGLNSYISTHKPAYSNKK